MKKFKVRIKAERESYNGYDTTEYFDFLVEARNSESAFNKALKLAKKQSNAYYYSPYSCIDNSN